MCKMTDCTNHNKIFGVSEDIVCARCIYLEDWREDHYKPPAVPVPDPNLAAAESANSEGPIVWWRPRLR